MAVFVANESGDHIDEVALCDLARFLLAELGVSALAELSVLLVDEQSMSDLHVRWMGEQGPTDVLAFPMDELTEHGSFAADDDRPGEPALLGDVVLCPPVAARQALERGHTPAHELDVLTTHGVLHLLGYDHAEPDEERAMFTRQAQLLTAWGAVRTR